MNWNHIVEKSAISKSFSPSCTRYLAFINVAFHHGAGHGRENVDENVCFSALRCFRDLILA